MRVIAAVAARVAHASARIARAAAAWPTGFFITAALCSQRATGGEALGKLRRTLR